MQARLRRVVNGKRYDVDTATVIASDEYWDGHNHERHGRNTHLYRTKGGRYFVVHSTMWQGERSRLEPLERDEAITLYEELPEHPVEYEEAFPGAAIEDA
jgi:hypothetical protein